MARATIKISVDIDLDAYRREYGEPDATRADAREYVEALIQQGAQQALRPFDYATLRDPDFD